MKSKDTNSSWSTFKRILSFARPYGLWLGIRIFGAVVSAAVDISLAFFVVRLVDLSLAGKRLELINTLYILAAIIAVGVIFSMLNRYSSGYISAYTGRDIKKKITYYIEKLPVSYMDSQHTGDILSMLTNDVAVVQGFIEGFLPNLIFQPLRFLGAFLYLLYINWRLLLFSIVIIPVAMLIANIISKPVSRYVEELQQFLGKINSAAQDIIGGIYILKAFNLNEVLFNKYRKEVDNALHKSLSVEKRGSMITPVNILMQILPFVLCILYGGYLSITGQITPGVLLAFIQMMNYLVEPAEFIPGFIMSTKGTIGAARHLFSILDQDAEPIGGKCFETKSSHYPIEFINSSFSYNNQTNILTDLSLKIPEGKSVALVGPSGTGKSTLIKLICGFYKLNEGKIKIYGHELSKWDLSAVRSKISIVSQDVYLFPATIAENIAYGKPGATLEDIVKSAKSANAHKFIMEMPDGYYTIIGERGIRLSGGQRQRISIARAILKDAPILLLDEPTSALDTQSEALVQEALERFMKNRTVLIIAHRLSTIKNVDEVLVLNQGRIIEKGTHRQLIEKGGLYRQLYLTQASSEGIKPGGAMAHIGIGEDTKVCLN